MSARLLAARALLQQPCVNEVTRDRLVRDSADWDKIAPAIAGWWELLERAGETRGTINALRCMLEAVYIMGYERGKAESKMPLFIATEEGTR